MVTAKLEVKMPGITVYVRDDPKTSRLFGKFFKEECTFYPGLDKFCIRPTDPEYSEVVGLLSRLAKEKQEREERAKLCELKRKYGDIDCE